MKELTPILLITLTILVIVGACTRTITPDVDVTYKALERIRYATDRRTGICFALLQSQTHSGYEVVSITAVPAEACR